MAWNEPGNGKDPWNRGDKEPNDLDQIVQNWQRRLSSLLGGRGGGGGRAPGGAGGYILIGLLLIAWGATGVYRIDEAFSMRRLKGRQADLLQIGIGAAQLLGRQHGNVESHTGAH